MLYCVFFLDLSIENFNPISTVKLSLVVLKYWNFHNLTGQPVQWRLNKRSAVHRPSRLIISIDGTQVTITDSHYWLVNRTDRHGWFLPWEDGRSSNSGREKIFLSGQHILSLKIEMIQALFTGRIARWSKASRYLKPGNGKNRREIVYRYRSVH